LLSVSVYHFLEFSNTFVHISSVSVSNRNDPNGYMDSYT